MENELVPVTIEEEFDSVTNLYSDICAAFPKAVENFKSRWAAAQALGYSEATPATGDDARIHTDEFDALKRLGPKIIPLVVFRLLKDDTSQNSWAVLLYNALENDYQYCPPLDKDLRRRSCRIIEFNRQRNKIVKQRIEAWKEHCRENSLQSSSFMFTDCDQYWDLLEMGPSIIAPLMVEYYYDPDGYWFQLLHEIIHRRKLGAYMYQKSVLYDECCQFFNEGEHEQAPKYTPTPMDRWIFHGEIMR